MITTLLATALGIVGTLTGVVITQRQANHRETVAWQRDRVHEQERWDREDSARTFEHRRIVYAEFYEALRDMTLLIYNFGMGLSEAPEGLSAEPEARELGMVSPDFQLPAFHLLQRLRIYGTPGVIAAANDAYNAAWRWGSRTIYSQEDGEFYDRQDEYDGKESKYLAAIRSDLKVPETLS